MRQPRWYEELPTPWDHDCRGKFELLSMNYPLGGFNEASEIDKNAEFTIFVFNLLQESGQWEWLVTNGVDTNTLRFAGYVKQDTYELFVKVLIDLPTKLRTMYALRFTQ